MRGQWSLAATSAYAIKTPFTLGLSKGAQSLCKTPSRHFDEHNLGGLQPHYLYAALAADGDAAAPFQEPLLGVLHPILGGLQLAGTTIFGDTRAIAGVFCRSNVFFAGGRENCHLRWEHNGQALHARVASLIR